MHELVRTWTLLDYPSTPGDDAAPATPRGIAQAMVILPQTTVPEGLTQFEANQRLAPRRTEFAYRRDGEPTEPSGKETLGTCSVDA